MPTYNRNFDLSVSDVDLIETALRARARELSTRLLALSEENPTHLDSIRAIQSDLKAGEEVLGRLHNQKVFYRPKQKVYVGG